MNRIWLLALGLAILSYSLAHVYRIAATALQILDHPNHRSAHSQVTPTGAGITFVAVFFLSVWLMTRAQCPHPEAEMIFRLLPALLVVTVLGLIDDFRALPWPFRFAVHTLCAAWVVYIIGFPLLQFPMTSWDTGIAGLAFGVIALVWLLNLYNFMDGIDGIAISEAVFAFCGASLVAWLSDVGLSQSVIVLIGTCMGFLVIIWPKARVFMGDGGSGFLGLILGALALAEVLVPVWSWMILLGWFIADACLTITLRALRGETIHEAHSQHAYQHLNRAIGTTRTLLIVHLVNLFWLLPLAWFAATAQEWGLFLLILALLPVLIGQFYCGAGQATPRMKAIKPD